MRQVFHEGLAFVTEEMIEMTRLVEQALANATIALLDGDLGLAEQVISGDAEVDALYRENEEKTVELITRQQPVARDLRVLVTALRSMASLERMGDLAAHIAETSRRQFPNPAVPPELRATFEDMSRTATTMISIGRTVLEEGDVSRVTEVRALDNVLDAHHRRMFSLIVERDYDVETAVNLVMLSRFFERYADHAVSFANRLLYLFTGEWTTAKE